MNTREGHPRDIPTLVTIDRASYGNYGADQNYFQKKIRSQNTKVLVSETSGKANGFVVFEIMEPGEKLHDFSNLHTTQPMREKWMHIIAFTTAKNFQDIDADTRLLTAAEESAKKLGCSLFCVPLSISHPYPAAFQFFENNGYHKAGTISWNAGLSEKIDCYFYQKRDKTNSL